MMSGPDPAARALSWVQATLGDRPMPPTAVVIGIGDGAVLTALNRMRSGVRILVVEPDEAAAAAFMASEGYRRRAADERLLCLGGPDYRGADQAWRLYPANPDDHLLLISPEAVRDRPRVRAAAHVVGKILFGARANAEARRQFAPRYLANSLANLPSIARGSSVAALSGAFAGRPVVVVGAGPSLDTALPDLVVLQDRAIVIATDTALRPLLHAGVAPHLVVGADPSARNARHFFGLPPCPRTWLVAESALDPDAAAIFAGRTFWFRLAHHDPWPWYQELGIDAAHVDMWGSVLTAAFQIALLGGGDPIAFIGADLAYTGGRPYARGTTYEFDWAYTAALGVGLDEAWRQQIALTERVTAASVAGTPVETSLPLQVFRDWLAARVPACGRRVLNATGGGILAGDGITQTTLRAAIGAAPPLTPPAWARVATTTTPLARLAEAVDEARRAVRSRPATDALVRTWTEFSGGVLDGAAVDGALARAEAALRHDGHLTRAVPSLPWPDLAAAGVPLSWFPALPAHIAAAASGPDERRDVDARAALWLLDPLMRALDAGADALALDQASAAAVTASNQPAALRPWPPLVAWPMRLLEALVPAHAAGDVPVSFFALPPLPPSGPAAALPLVPLARAAAAQLSARWMRAVVGTADGSEAARVRGVARLFETAVAAAGDVDAVPDAPRPGPALSVSLSWTGAPTVRITRPVDRMMVPRVLTGALSIAGGGSAPVRLASFAARGARIEVDVTGLTAVTTPRVLTSEGLAPAVSAYAAEGGVIVAPLHGDTSVWIGEDGTCKPHLSWPRTMVGQAAMGEGAVAWSNGTEAWPECGPAYVMYRTTVDGPVTVQLLPFRPTAGIWFDGHLYWNTFRHGLGRWRPDAQPELLLADRSFCGLVSGDDGLALAPCTRDQEGRVVRQVQTHGWQLAAAGAWAPVALAAEGAVTSRAAGPDGWTATAFPDVDLVAFERPGRRIDVTCHYPMTLAWAGRSLVICTAPGDVLLFERLADTLASLA